MTWHLIRLNLARSPEFPEGSPDHFYLLRAPVDATFMVDLAALRAAPERAEVLRSTPEERDRHGYLIHNRKGWVFSYAPGETDDEPLFHLEAHSLRIGEYVTVTEADGTPFAFVVAQCDPLEDS